MSPIPISAGTSRVCFAQTQDTAVMSKIPNPDHTAYTIPVGIVCSGKERSQKAAMKQMNDMTLGMGFEKLWDAASATVAITSVRIAPAKHR